MVDEDETVAVGGELEVIEEGRGGGGGGALAVGPAAEAARAAASGPAEKAVLLAPVGCPQEQSRR